jgi:hypothetical protein
VVGAAALAPLAPLYAFDDAVDSTEMKLRDEYRIKNKAESYQRWL